MIASNESIFVRLNELIDDRNISEVSKEIDIPEKKIKNWLRKKMRPKISDIISLAKYFKCTSDFLLGLEDEFGNRI